jgi:hypothetical protein
MRYWMSQIVIGIIVTVVGSVIAHAVIKGISGKGKYGGGHYAGSWRSGR